jgi:hypothetical protein
VSLRPLAFLLAIFAGCSSPDAADRKVPAKTAVPVEPKIVHFYASPGAVPKGGSATVCYGVENAEAVRIDPPVETLKPSFNRCFPVTPAATTKYTLTAASKSGKETELSFVLTVGPPEAPQPSQATLILFFTASAAEVRPGQPVTLCYGVKGAARVALRPNVRAIQPLERACFQISFDTTTTLTLTATDSAGNRDTESVTVRVQ